MSLNNSPFCEEIDLPSSFHPWIKAHIPGWERLFDFVFWLLKRRKREGGFASLVCVGGNKLLLLTRKELDGGQETTKPINLSLRNNYDKFPVCFSFGKETMVIQMLLSGKGQFLCEVTFSSQAMGNLVSQLLTVDLLSLEVSLRRWYVLNIWKEPIRLTANLKQGNPFLFSLLSNPGNANSARLAPSLWI